MEDWMSVSVHKGYVDSECCELDPPNELLQLHEEADVMRNRATSPDSGVNFGEWAAFADKMRKGLGRAGIAPGVHALRSAICYAHDSLGSWEKTLGLLQQMQSE